MICCSHIHFGQKHALLVKFAFPHHVCLHLFGSLAGQGSEHTVLHRDGGHQFTPHLLDGRWFGRNIRLSLWHRLLTTPFVKELLDETFLLLRW